MSGILPPPRRGGPARRTPKPSQDTAPVAANVDLHPRRRKLRRNRIWTGFERELTVLGQHGGDKIEEGPVPGEAVRRVGEDEVEAAGCGQAIPLSRLLGTDQVEAARLQELTVGTRRGQRRRACVDAPGLSGTPRQGFEGHRGSAAEKIQDPRPGELGTPDGEQGLAQTLGAGARVRSRPQEPPPPAPAGDPQTRCPTRLSAQDASPAGPVPRTRPAGRRGPRTGSAAAPLPATPRPGRRRSASPPR